MDDRLHTGLNGKSTCTVDDLNTAICMGSGDLPVYATPSMIALMESAALRAVVDALPEGTTTVGTKLDIQHIAATPIGLAVHATAELITVEGKKLIFKVQAFDEKEKIGEGVHERFVVQTERFVAKAAMKK